MNGSSTVIGASQNRVFQENKARQIFQKTNISYPYMRELVGKKCSFLVKLGVLCFLKTPAFETRPFGLLPTNFARKKSPGWVVQTI